MSDPTPTGEPPAAAGDTRADDDLLAALADEFLRRLRAGEQPTVDDYARSHPRLASAIRDLFPAMIAMEQPGFGPAALDPAPPAERVGATVGRYKLLERIGEGGFGVVFMADQQFPVRRKVALKVIKPGVDTKQVIARFEAERQALALMEHENIAKVLDAGATDSGRPYFVMELVHGVPITEFCDKNQLPPRERLELFVQVCRAVQHAHTKGIIHRDIKPTNVLVTLHEGRAVPKVIDFGVAKATGQQLTEKTLFTHFAQMVGTPLYMSPEQAEMTGVDVDTRSDIYSLGVLLYELLTGTTPLDKERLKQAAFDEVRRIIREEEPPRPSTRISTMGEQDRRTISAQRRSDAKHLGRLIRGELDWIVMRALEKERARRYETANGLARDIERYLNDEAVQACPPSATYRLRKFARRNRAGLAVTSAALLALLTLVVGLAVSNRMIARERDRTGAALRGEQQARADETTQRVRAQELERATRGHLYANQINLAQQAWENAEIIRMNELLSAQIPGPGAEDLRGFEWYYLWRLAHSERMAFFAGDDPVRAMAMSPDGNRLASASGRSIKLWDRAGQRFERELPLDVMARCVQFSPDGRFLAAGGGTPGKPGAAYIWDLADPSARRTLNDVGETVLCVAFSPDGSKLATGTARLRPGGGLVYTRVLYVSSADERGEIRLWERDSGKQVGVFDGQTNGILCLAFSRDGERLLAGSWDKTLSTWDVKTRARAGSPKTFSGFVWSAAFSPDGKLLAVGSGDWDSFPGTTLLDARTLEERATLYGHRAGTAAVAFSPDGKTLATGSFDHTARLWDVASGRQTNNIRGHTGFVAAVAFTPDGKSLATASWDKSVRLWDVTAAQGETAIGADRVAVPYCLAFAPDSRMLAGSGYDAFLLDVAAEMPLHQMKISSGDQMIAVSPDGSMLATGGIDGVARVWDARGGRLLQSLSANGATLWDVAFSPDGKVLVTGGTDQSARLWDLATGRVIRSFDKQGGTVRTASFSADGTMLAIGASGAPAAKVYDPRSGQLLDTIPGLGVHVRFTPDAKTIVGATGLGVQFWDRERRSMRSSRTGHTEATYDMAVSADGRTVATASWDGTVKLWHVGSGDLMLTLKPEGGAVWTVAFSPDGRMLAAGAGTTINRRRVLKIWHAASGADVSTDPTLLDQMNLRAWTLRQAGQLQEAAALRQQVVEGARASMSHGDPRRIRYQLDCSVLLTQTKQYEQSERLLLESQAALEESNADPALALRAAGQFAELYEAWGKPEKVAHYRARLPALRAATQPSAATQQSPANHVVGRVVSAADPQQRRSQAVAELLEKKLTLLGADCDTFYIRAAAHARRNEADQAKLWLAAGDQRVERHCVDVNRAKALRGEAIRAFEESGVALPPPGTKPAAQLSLYEEFIQTHPDAAWAYQLRGQSYDEMGETTKAEADYRRALELLARENGIALDDARQLENFAANAAMRRQWELSLAAYGLLIESHVDKQPPTTRDQPATDKHNNAAGPAPDIGKMFASRGSVYLAMGDLDNAELNHSKALELTPRPPAGAPWDDYARIFLRRRTWPKTATADEKLKFKRFADSYGAALRARVEATPDDHEAWYRLAPFLLWQDDVDGYRRACREMVERFESSDRPEVAERTAKTCSLAPGAVGDPSRLVKLADRALKGNESHAFYGFFQLCKGVAEHRAGNHAASIEWLERMGPTVDQRNPWHAIAYSVIAMSQHHLGQAEQARASLDRARAVLAIDAQRPGQGDWFDWLHCEILFREAEKLIGE